VGKELWFSKAHYEGHLIEEIFENFLQHELSVPSHVRLMTHHTYVKHNEAPSHFSCWVTDYLNPLAPSVIL
jgi:hypothetical protein